MKVKNWEKFQHYKRRNPPWIRLYRSLLDDPEWFALDSDASRMLANCWLLASERNGSLPDVRTIAFRLRMTEKAVAAQLSKLNHWLEHDASTPLASRAQLATPETETETDNSETETEARKRASRLSKDWWPSEADIEFALSHGLNLDRISIEAEKFRNYWTAKAGKDAAKLDWSATWRNWILKASENVNGQGPRRQSLGDRASELAEQARRLERDASARGKVEPFGSH